MEKYYDIHIFFTKKDSYSKFYKTNSNVLEADIPAEAFKKGFIDKEEWDYNDYCGEISEEEYNRIINI